MPKSAQGRSRDELAQMAGSYKIWRWWLYYHHRRRHRRRKKPIIASIAKENLVTHTSNGYQGLTTLSKAPVNTRAMLAKSTGVSEGTMAKIEKIATVATPEMKAELRNGNMSNFGT